MSQLPQTFNVPYQLPTGGTTYRLHQGDDLQAAIDSANLGDVIILDAGATFTGNFKLPAKSGNGWLYIISSEMASLPAEGNRVSPSDAVHMPKLVSANSKPAIQTDFSAHHYRFSGIEISTAVYNYNLVLMGYSADTTATPTTVDQLPNNITFDRSYIHSSSDVYGARTGLNLEGSYLAVVDSYISNFKDHSDAQAIVSWWGPGPIKIVNNYLEGSGENVMFGGEHIPITNIMPADIEFRGNYSYKPLAWQNQISWKIKNIFELKAAKRVLVDGNVFENNWLHAQNGTAILFTVRNQYGDAPWSTIQDVTFTNNRIRHTPRVFNILLQDNLQASVPAERILVQNNVAEDIDLNLGASTRFINIATGGTNPGVDIAFKNNLFLTVADQAGSNFFSFEASSTSQKQVENFTFDNNIVIHNNYGLSGNSIAAGTASLDQYSTNYEFLKNVVIMRTCDVSYSYWLANFAAKYPANNFAVDGVAAVGFADYANGNYRLIAGSSYKNQGIDGKDPGPDWDILNAATANTLTGGGTYTPPPPLPTTYTIQSSAGPNGSISPSGARTVSSGASQSFTITANSGYQVASVLADGSSIGAVTSYTFSNVTTDHTISVSFTAVSLPACTSFTYSAWGACQSNSAQSRTMTSSSPAGCTGGSPVLSQSCAYVALINPCTSFTYSAWGACQSNSTQSRTMTSSLPAGCTGGSPVLSQSCTYSVPATETENIETSSQTPDEPLYLQLNGSLYYGKTTPEVTTLQKMLAKDETIFPEQKISGIFGKITETAVQRFQCKYLSLCSGSYNTNGYGTVGPRTVKKLNEIYGSSSVAPQNVNTPQMSQSERETLIAQLKAQIADLLRQVIILLQEQIKNKGGTT